MEIVKEAKKFDELELQILLTKLRVKIMQKEGVKLASNPPKALKLLTMKKLINGNTKQEIKMRQNRFVMDNISGVSYLISRQDKN